MNHWHISILTDIHICSDYQTPICFVHDIELLNLLTEHGASLNVVDKNGWNLLMNFVANKTRLLSTFHCAIEKIFN